MVSLKTGAGKTLVAVGFPSGSAGRGAERGPKGEEERAQRHSGGKWTQSNDSSWWVRDGQEIPGIDT